jgi:hypothetical protein
MGDRTKWFKRKKMRIDVGNGFKTISRPSVSKQKERKGFTTRDDSQHESQQQLLHSRGGGSSQSGTSLPSARSINFQRGDEVSSDSDESQTDIEEVGFFICINVIIMILTTHQRNTPMEAMISYIFEVCWSPYDFSDATDAPVYHRTL